MEFVPQLLPWREVERFLHEQIELYRRAMEDATTDAELHRAQGAVKALRRLANLPQTIALTTPELSGDPIPVIGSTDRRTHKEL